MIAPVKKKFILLIKIFGSQSLIIGVIFLFYLGLVLIDLYSSVSLIE